ncbi:uncharacterized, partial [Tachysurus ichikawai]
LVDSRLPALCVQSDEALEVTWLSRLSPNLACRLSHGLKPSKSRDAELTPSAPTCRSSTPTPHWYCETRF